MRTLIKGGNVIDPDNIEGKYDILIEGDKIIGIENVIDLNEEDADVQIINAKGKVVVPGLVDMHVHFRDPGEEYKECIESGSKAAAAGGITAVCTMPNTKPVNDSGIITEYIVNKAKDVGLIKVFPVGAISKDLKGEQLSEFGEMKKAGAVAVSDDGNPVVSSLLMRRALEYAETFDLRVISHCEDISLAANGVMNESPLSTQMGLPGIPNASECIMVTRDILLSELTNFPVHIAHVSTRESVHAVRDAKKRGVKVTCETTPHYFTLTHDAVKGYDTHAKMNPPLRAEEDRLAIIEGLIDGTIDAIATDHAPHSSIEKDVEFDWAANGILGLETSLSLSLKLVEDKKLTLSDLIRRMSNAPSSILGLEHGLCVGKSADITIIDLDKVFKIDADTLLSKSRNTPFDQWQMKGKAVYTIVNGKISYQDTELTST